ncbi:MAG: histidine kinase [Acidobacteria bacterium]|jgi:DNA-binding NtrC family response regulator|nr:MAG: histidine kinase [Acidobacteriota bacterium]
MKAQLEMIVSQMYSRGMRFEEAVREFQGTFIVAVLRESNGNQGRAAKKLGMHRNTLRRTIRSLQLDLQAIREAARRRPPRKQPMVTMRQTKVGA